MKVIIQHLILLSLILFPFWGNGQSYISQDFPSYESVVKHFIKNYVEPIRPHVLHFEKRPEGYFVSFSSSPISQQRTKQEMLWSNKTKSFQKLKKYTRGGRKIKSSELFFPYLRQRHEFDFCPFAGYPGWQRDVMKHFENEPNLPDTLLYGLGRAYSTFVANMIYDYSGGNTDTLHQFNLPKQKDAMTPKQLETFRKYAYLARKSFLRLHEQNPDFETIVGKIYIKYCNEIMWNFLQLQYIQNEKEARKELMPGLYDKFYINAAKNYLNSCPPNAILFTYGDNDTYPLLYVQGQLNFRTDVLVVNLSLINIDRYINHIRDGVFNAAPFPMTFDPSFYKDEKNGYVAIDNIKNETFLDLKQVISDLEKGKYIKETFDQKNISQLPTRKYYWNLNLEKIKASNIIPKNLEHLTVQKLEWELNKYNTYLYKGDLAFLSMLIANNWERPICIGATSRPQNFLGLDKYFHLEGLAYRMYPVKSNSEKPPYLHGAVHAKATYRKLMYDFLWDGIDHVEAGRKIYAQTYFVIFSETSKALKEQGENEKAEALLDLYFKNFPNHVKAYEIQAIYLIDQYFQLGKNKKAEKIGLQIIENYANKKPLSDKEMSQLGQLPLNKSKVLSDAFNEKIGW